MAIDLQNPTNISTGWHGPPDFRAPEIGGLVGHILQNRILQRAQQDKEIADAIKQYQTQREDDAYIKAAQATGVLPAGDYGELGAKGGGDIARLIELQRQRTAQAGLYSSEEEKNRAMAEWIRSGKPLSAGKDTDGTDTTGEDTRQNPVTGAWEYRTVSARGVVNWHPYPVGMQPRTVRTTGPLPAAQEPENQLRTKYNLDPEELYQWSPEYGMATLDTKGKPDPNSFQATAPGSGTGGLNQPFVRVTKADGGQVVMSRAEYERFKGQVTPQEYYGNNQGQAQLSASPSPSATPPRSARVGPDASKGAPVNTVQVGDQKPGPNGTTIEWDGHGWFVVQ